MSRPIAKCLNFEEFVGRSDAVYKSTREATTAQKLKRKALCIGLILHRSYYCKRCFKADKTLSGEKGFKSSCVKRATCLTNVELV